MNQLILFTKADCKQCEYVKSKLDRGDYFELPGAWLKDGMKNWREFGIIDISAAAAAIGWDGSMPLAFNIVTRAASDMQIYA